MDLRSFLAQSAHMTAAGTLEEFATNWDRKPLRKGSTLARQAEPDMHEYIVLQGCLVSSICDHDGREACVGLYAGPCVLTPNIARTRGGESLVSITATTQCTLARIDSARLSDLMIDSEPVRDWANAVLRAELSAKADREWCLAALGGADRLRWFREAFAGFEDIFTHSHIASFLGVTPVTLSRLRASTK